MLIVYCTVYKQYIVIVMVVAIVMAIVIVVIVSVIVVVIVVWNNSWNNWCNSTPWNNSLNKCYLLLLLSGIIPGITGIGTL